MAHLNYYVLFLVTLALAPWPLCTNSLRLTGSVNFNETFFMFLAKFGFQKTEVLSKEDTQGYIYGNISFASPHSQQNQHVILAALDRANFLEYYGNRSIFNKQKACEKMFDKVNSVTYDAVCNQAGEQDFLRAVPCPANGFCPDEDNIDNVVKGAQFTFRIQDLYQARFWYISLVACRRNVSTCAMDYVEDLQGEINYDIHLVNGNPGGRNRNFFKFQFSSDVQDLLEVYLILLLVYTVLTPLQLHAARKQKHPITRLLAADLTVQYVALIMINIHYGLFAANGQGVEAFAVIGEVLEIISQSMFMLLLLLLAMGWAITRQELTCKFSFFTLWSLYTLLSCLLYIWMKTEVDVVEDIEEYQTVPGMLTLALRVIVMISFVIVLRDTMFHEYNQEKLSFFLHFGAASLVWFNYLPLLAVVALPISALWREKFLIGVSYSVDTFAFAILMHLLWPSRSQQYFMLAVRKTDHTEELEELCQAANHLNESGGESGGELWLRKNYADDPEELLSSSSSDGSVTDLVVI